MAFGGTSLKMSGTLTAAMRMHCAIRRARYRWSSMQRPSVSFGNERVIEHRTVETRRDRALGRVAIEDGHQNRARREHHHRERMPAPPATVSPHVLLNTSPDCVTESLIDLSSSTRI